MFFSTTRGKQLIALGALTAMLATLTGCQSQKANAATAADASAYSSTGVVECSAVDVRAKIPGKIILVNVAEGDQVKAGDVLFATDPADLAVKKAQAQAAVNAAQAVLEKAHNGARSQEVAAAQALYHKAQANVDLLSAQLGKMQSLNEAGAVAQDNIDKLTTQLTAAGLDSEAARQQYELAKAGARPEDIKAAQAQYDGAKAQLAEVQLNLDATKVVAPVDGTVSMLAAGVGELIATGTPVVTLTNYQDSWVLLNVDETHIAQMTLGGSMDLTSKAYADQVFHGTIKTISKNPDFATKKSTNELNDKDVVSYEVKIALPAGELHLYPGMSIEAKLPSVTTSAPSDQAPAADAQQAVSPQ